MTGTDPVPSPCTRVCVMDPRTGLCRGCKRTIGELAEWGGMTPARRRAVLADLARRPGSGA